MKAALADSFAQRINSSNILNPQPIAGRTKLENNRQGSVMAKNKPATAVELGVDRKMHMNSLPLGVMYMEVQTYEHAVKEGEKLLKLKNEGVDDMGKC